MPQLTVHTIVDRDRFADELRLVKKRGFAVDDGENEEGGRCVAVSIPIPSPRAAVSVSAPAGRLPTEHVESVAAALIRATRSIADEIGRDALLDADGTRR